MKSRFPRLFGKTEKTRNGMDDLEGSFTRPRQVRYQAALRPDTNGLFDSRLPPKNRVRNLHGLGVPVLRVLLKRANSDVACQHQQKTKSRSAIPFSGPGTRNSSPRLFLRTAYENRRNRCATLFEFGHPRCRPGLGEWEIYWEQAPGCVSTVEL